jgi:serine/threonine protein kinase
MANLLLRGALILLLLPAVVNSESHWESYADWAMGYIWSCYPYYYTECSDWYSYPYYLGYNACTCSRYQQFSNVCYQRTGWNCYTNCIGWILVTRWRCQYGWQGANCEIPICNNPACTVDQICVKPFTCDCPRSSTGECLYEPCEDAGNNCYPGFCNKTGNPWICICPAGFTGPNCQTVTNNPEIKNCYVQIFGTPNGQAEQEVARASECAAPGLDPLPVWIGQRAANQLTKIIVTWEAHYANQVPLPGRSRAPYILDAPVPIGIVETNFTVSFPDQPRFAPQSTFCIGPDPVYNNAPAIKQCTGIPKQWSDLGVSSIVKTNVSFLVTIEAQPGGVKRGDNNWVGGRFTTDQRFSMDPTKNSTIRTTKFAFDLEPPYHCLHTSNCSVFPIFLNRTISSNPIIQPTFNGWKDDGSGIDRYYVEVYYMQPDAQNLLVPTGAPLRAENVNITLNNFRFTCPNPGAYSIVLTVYDKANNSARARKIFNYDNHESSFYETASPIYLSAADPNTTYRFITRLEKQADGTTPYQFNVIWDGHFANSNQEDWLREVRPWGSTDDYDDNYGSRFGLRSIDSLIKENGVSGYELAYSVDNRTGGVGAVPPSTFTVITDRSKTSFPISIPASLKDGDTIIVWLNVSDLYGNWVMIVSRTSVDTSRFGIVVVGDPMFAKHFPEQFTSSLVIDVVSRISGIKNITYQIYDNSIKQYIRNETFFPVVLETTSALGSRKRRTVDRPCLSTDPTCYCIPLGQCYNRTQFINIDNCWIDRVAGDEIHVRFTVYSMAGWGLSGEINAGTLSQEDIPCRSLGLGLSRGAIIGICIGSIIFFFLLLLLIILLILMLVRSKVYHKHPLPMRIRTTIHNTFGRNSAPTMNIISDNELYASKGDVAPSVNKKSKESRLWANKLWDAPPGKSGEKCENWIVSGKNLQIGDVITEGRFAIIRKGFLTTGNEKNPVAIKALRSGYDKGDPEVMSAKIDFMANQFKPHPNIIRFLGIVAEDKQVPPVMLLELCDKTLKDWLSEIIAVDAEVLEDMLSFTLHIARGVQHLHDQKIIHRRLAVRNVLLKRAIGGFEAKLIGFGPSREDAEERPNNEQSTLGLSVVPLKWMAPETLDTLSNRKPTYDEKTDTWSYGVTIWEIYSKGDAPYANHKSADIRAVLKRGERLTCPEACHPDLFNGVIYPCWNASPKKRPSFTKIGTFIEQFRNGMSSSAGGGYYAAPSVASSSGIEAPPGYYAARDALQGDNGRDNTALYHDARSG